MNSPRLLPVQTTPDRIVGGVPLAPFGAQPSALLYVGLPETLLLLVPSDGAGNAAAFLGIPANASLLGLQASGPWFAIDATLPYPLQFATSPGALITIGN